MDINKIKKGFNDFWYGKPHSAEEGGRRLGEILEDKTGLYKHREWRGVKDTMYYFWNIWCYNYLHMVEPDKCTGCASCATVPLGITEAWSMPV